MYNPACPQLNPKRNPIVLVSRGSRMWCGLRSVYSVLPLFLMMPPSLPQPLSPKTPSLKRSQPKNKRPSSKYPSARVEMKIQKITHKRGKSGLRRGRVNTQSIFETQAEWVCESDKCP